MYKNISNFTDHVYNDDGVFAEASRALVEVGLVQLEGRYVRREDRRVDHQDQYQPIPSGLPKKNHLDHSRIGTWSNKKGIRYFLVHMSLFY